MPGGWIRRGVLSVLASTILACGGSPDAPSQNPPLNLTGTWSGVVGAGSGVAERYARRGQSIRPAALSPDQSLS